jgi:hypothetical protein
MNSVIAKLALLLLQVLILSWVCFVSGGYFGAVTPHTCAARSLLQCASHVPHFPGAVSFSILGAASAMIAPM